MASNTIKKEVVALGDDLINQAIAAIQSTEPTPEEMEAEQLAKLIPSIRMAMDRGESHDKIRKKLKSVIASLHYSKVDALLAAATKLASDRNEHADQCDRTSARRANDEPRI